MNKGIVAGIIIVVIGIIAVLGISGDNLKESSIVPELEELPVVQQSEEDYITEESEGENYTINLNDAVSMKDG